MAKQKFDLGATEAGGTKRSGHKKDLFENPLQTSSASQRAAKVTGRKTDAAGRVRKTIFLEPTTINVIEDLASAEGYTKMDFYEWLVLMGMEQFEEGVRPEIERRQVVKGRIKIER